MKRNFLPAKPKRQKQLRTLVIASLLGFFCALWGGEFQVKPSSQLIGQPVMAQILRPEEVAQQIYQRFPELPQENQYINQETAEADLDNTLMSRFISYHQYVKRRPTNFRFDWKLTLADYLGAYETIQTSRYPGHSTLQVNPVAGDIEAIKSLNLRQRNQLVDALVSIYDPEGRYSFSNPDDNSNSSTEPAANPRQSSPSFPQPGDAELLLP